MLSSSPSKIHEPLVTGVSPRPTDQRQRQKTAKHEGSKARFEIFEPGLRRLYSSEVQLRLVVGPGPARLPRRTDS